MGSNIICEFTYLLTNNAQELTLYRFEFKRDTNRSRKYFLAMPEFEPRSLRQTTDALTNFATAPLFKISIITSFLILL
jgi:hypothetical protein